MDVIVIKGSKRYFFEGAVVIILLTALLFFRLQYGFDQTDESYYYALAKRFYQGDIPFIDEWYPSQFFAVLLVPFYGIYTYFVPSGEGIILAGRYAYLALQTLVALSTLWVFKEEKKDAIAFSVIYMMCSRQNIAGLSYYNLYMTFCFCAVILYYSYLKSERAAFLHFFAIGICFSLATLCMPFFSILVAAVLIGLLVRRNIRNMGAIMVGIFLCAMCYVSFLLFRASLSDYLSAIGNVLSNPDYADLSVSKKIIGTVLSVGKICIFGLPGFVYIIYSNKRNISNAVFLLSLIICGIVFGTTTPGAIYIQTFFLGLAIMIKEFRHNLKSAISLKGCRLFMFGIFAALLFWVGSDTEASCLPLGLLISVMGVLLLLRETAESIALFGKTISMVTAVGIFICVCAVSSRMLGPCYRDNYWWNLDAQITYGPAKGLYTEQSDLEDYEKVMNTINYIESGYEEAQIKDANILFSKFLPWAYLAIGARNASMTPWRSALSDKRLQMYYQSNPEKFPDIVVVFDEDVGETNGLSGGEQMNSGNTHEGALWDEIQSFEIEKTASGIVYFAK